MFQIDKKYISNKYFYIGLMEYKNDKFINITKYPKIPIFNAAGLMLTNPQYKFDFLDYPHTNQNDFYQSTIKNEHYSNFDEKLLKYYWGTEEYYEKYKTKENKFFLGKSKSLQESTIYDKINFNMDDKKINLSMSSKIIYKSIDNFSYYLNIDNMYSGLFLTKTSRKPISICNFECDSNKNSYGDGCGNFYTSHNSFSIEISY